MSSTAPKDSLQTHYDAQVTALQGGRFKDPFSFLGTHAYKNGYEIRVYLPAAKNVNIIINDKKVIAKRYNSSDLFIATSNEMPTQPYKCNIEYANSALCFYDEYSFASSLDTDAMYLFNEGSLEHAYKHLGAHFINQQGVDGVRFCVWAPNAASVSVIGEFNLWQANRHYMRFHPACGVWELFIAGLQPDTCYKFSIVTQQGDVLEKADPFAFKMQQAPGTASVLQQQATPISLSDSELKNRQKRNHIDAPISIYEVHLGSWQRAEENRYLSYSELADKLVNYTLEMGFTHIQLMPISEYLGLPASGVVCTN